LGVGIGPGEPWGTGVGVPKISESVVAVCSGIGVPAGNGGSKLDRGAVTSWASAAMLRSMLGRINLDTG
jgi:hypothetical protein